MLWKKLKLLLEDRTAVWLYYGIEIFRIGLSHCHSNRICVVQIHLDKDENMILICVYMPCDARRRGHNLTEFIDTLNDIAIMCNSADVDCMRSG